MTETSNPTIPNPTLLTGLAMAGGLGITIMVVALGIGVIVPDADNRFVGLAVLTGLIFLVGSVGSWLALVQPFKHFDDINIPADDDHHHETHAETDGDSVPAQH